MTRLDLAKWTKLRSVRRWVMTLAAVIGLTVLVALIEFSEPAAATPTEGRSSGPISPDEAPFVYQPLSGDGGIVARVVSQEDSHEWAKAGVMVKGRLGWAPPTPRCWVTPDHGVRLQWDFGHDVAGSEAGAARGGSG